METTLLPLVRLAARHASATETPTAIAGLTIWHSTARTAPTPAMYDPKVYLLLQGAKRLSVGGKRFDFRAGGYAISSVGVPFTGEVIEASEARPYLALGLALNVGLVTELLLTMETAVEEAQATPALAFSQLNEAIIEPAYRLLRLLDTPADIAMLAPLAERELYYRLLQGSMGHTLRQAVRHHPRFAQIRSAVAWISDNAHRAMSVSHVAREVGMSLTSFHRHFKLVTGLSPLAFQRQVRLLHARQLLGVASTSVAAVAYQVGYASAAQFSREYSNLFGTPPVRDTVRALRR
jgi:AraC-like DNA-binding protein